MPSGVNGITPTPLIKTSKPLPPRDFSICSTASWTLSSDVTSIETNSTRPGYCETNFFKASVCRRAAVKTFETSKAGLEARILQIPRLRPLELPVTRYEAIAFSNCEAIDE